MTAEVAHELSQISSEKLLLSVQAKLEPFALYNDNRRFVDGEADNSYMTVRGGIGTITLRFMQRSTVQVSLSGDNGIDIAARYKNVSGIYVIPHQLHLPGALAVRFVDEPDAKQVCEPHRWADGGYTLRDENGNDRSFADVLRVFSHVAALQNPDKEVTTAQLGVVQ